MGGWPLLEKDATAASKVRNVLLNSTLRHLSQSVPYYRELLRGIRFSKVDPRGVFHRLPIMNKADVRRLGDMLLSESYGTDYVHCTSGTSGRPLYIHRSRDEDKEADALHDGLFPSESSYIDGSIGGNGGKPKVLILSDYRHGDPKFERPVGCFKFTQAIVDEISAKNVIDLLRAPPKIAGTSDRFLVVGGAVSHVLALTHFARDRGYSLQTLGVMRLVVYGRYMGRATIKFLSDSWGCQIVSNYSQSESFGFAARMCPGAHYRFSVFAYPEIVNEVGEHCKIGQPGRLLLTSLVPFRARHSIIRYDTGDLFTYTLGECGVPLFRYLGRRERCAFGNDALSSLILAESDVIDAVDGLVGLERRGSILSCVSPNSRFSGAVEYEVNITQKGSSQVPVLEVSFPFKEAGGLGACHGVSGDLQEQIRGELINQSHSLREVMDRQSLELVVNLKKAN